MEGAAMNQNTIEALRAEIKKLNAEAMKELEPLWEANEDDDHEEDYDDTVARLTLEGFTEALEAVLAILDEAK
jgi:predicted Ser/Thr protein kinase